MLNLWDSILKPRDSNNTMGSLNTNSLKGNLKEGMKKIETKRVWGRYLIVTFDAGLLLLLLGLLPKP
jgi:hypothetical protein